MTRGIPWYAVCSLARGEPRAASGRVAPRRSVSSFLIDSARQSRPSDLLGRTRDGRWFSKGRTDRRSRTGRYGTQGQGWKSREGAFIGRGGTRTGFRRRSLRSDCHRKSAARFPSLALYRPPPLPMLRSPHHCRTVHAREFVIARESTRVFRNRRAGYRRPRGRA